MMLVRMEIPVGTIAYDGNYFSLRIDDHSKEFVYAGNEVLTVPLTAEGEVIFNIEPSPAFGVSVLVLSGGETTADESHSETAGRELREEVGYAPGRLHFLGEIRPYSKYLTVRSFVYLARDLVPGKLKGDEDYEIPTRRVPLASFENLIADGYLQDARVIAALYMARSFLQQE